MNFADQKIMINENIAHKIYERQFKNYNLNYIHIYRTVWYWYEYEVKLR